MISTDRIQNRLLALAGIFVLLYAIGLTISPAVRFRTWDVTYRWDHWIGVAVWVLVFALADEQLRKRLPERDPFLLPAAALLTGWGLLSIWRISPGFGLRQSAWLAIVMSLFILSLRLPGILDFLRRYKYLWLTAGLLLTALTLIFGTNPSGGWLPRLWLGCCGVYFQPSEPLKLLLIVYLSAYLAGSVASNRQTGDGLLPLLAPTLIMTGLALLLLVFQRDLGTASIFLFIYSVTVYIASGRRAVLLASAIAVGVAAGAGYLLFDVVKLRVDAWLNPWVDPSGRSYQIVQSLLAVANGGFIGRGPGLGSPTLVPVPQSDFIFAAIVEESGLIGAVALLGLLALLAGRGLHAALCAASPFRRYLAAGLSAFLIGQSILIIGGNLRLLPLTGVTLPFVSYGGSSLLVSVFSLLILLHISAQGEEKTITLYDLRPYLGLAGVLLTGLAAAALMAGWWTLYRGPDLLTRTDNPRRTVNDRFVKRGSLLDRSNTPIDVSEGQPGSYTRLSLYPALGPIAGYTNPIYGQSGLEASLDPYLRGLQGSPSTLILYNQILFGQNPPGLDVRLSIDLGIQKAADQALGSHKGALVLLDARSGDILAIASHPSFDPNQLDQEWAALIQDPNTPLFDRAAMGQYQPGPSLGPFLLAQATARDAVPAMPQTLAFNSNNLALNCAIQPAATTWEAVIAAGCPAPAVALGQQLAAGGQDSQGQALLTFLRGIGLYNTPSIRLPAASSPFPASGGDVAKIAAGQADLRVSPLQMAIAASSLSNDGLMAAPRITVAVKTPQSGWVILAQENSPQRVFPQGVANRVASSLAATNGLPVWQSLATADAGQGKALTWYLAGSLPSWNGTPFALALVIEEKDPAAAQAIGEAVIREAVR